MVSRLRRIKAVLGDRYPQSRLKPLTAKEIAHLQRRFPRLPAHLLQFFREIGCGCIGESRYMIYALLSPEEVFDKGTAARLQGVFLVGDDFAGGHEAYDTRGARWRFGSIGRNGRFEPHTVYKDFPDFIEKWFVDEQAV